MFQSNMSKNTVDGNCMTKKMLKVMFSTKPTKEKKIIPMNKKGDKNKLFFFVSNRVRTCDLRVFI